VDGLLFSPGESQQLANLFLKVAVDRDLRHRLSQKARRAALERFRLERMVDEIEGFLQSVVKDAKAGVGLGC
jgi:hypothetical protein